MQDKTLIKISLAWSLLGLFIIMLIAAYSEPKTIQISEMDQNVGKTIVIFGNVEKAKYGKTSFIDLYDVTGNTTAVIFDNPENKTKAGDYIGVKGKVQLYKSNFEIIADEIRCVKC
ncbi:MAG: OB-fold nucleic acid binding domain-containing protein [DPANN group archaeon]|nr:OB-fold nucleic acid binding domain-containing protein [DPANN group archaeon]